MNENCQCYKYLEKQEMLTAWLTSEETTLNISNTYHSNTSSFLSYTRA